MDVLHIASDVLLGATSGNAGVAVVFETPDGRHEVWVPEQALAVFRDRPLPSVTWHHDHNDLLLDGAVDVAAADDLTPLLRAVDTFGIGLARRLPTEPGQVLEFADRIGFVRETNYGRLFDVIVEPDPINLAFTPLGLPLHTDNPYRDPVPTLQSMEPPDMATDVLHEWYRAYRSLCAILADPGSAMEITLEPSDLVVFDNRRVLHGRSAFAVTDRRHLQGCYADIDAIRSALRIREAS